MVHRLRVLVSAVMAVVTAGLIAPARAETGAATCPLARPDGGAAPRPALAPTRAYRGTDDTTVYLERHGGVLRPGYDDSAAGTSALVYSAGLSSLAVPAFGGNDRAWREVVACVERGLAPYAVDVVDQRPQSGDYTMMMIGGKASLLGYGSGVSGVAPYSGELLHGAVGFVFAASVRNGAEQVCQSALHEIGHTLGLDHVYECRDVMSYLHGCGEKSFTDVEARCGEHGARECGDGEARQNSHQRLVATVGLRVAEVGDGNGWGEWAAPELEPARVPELELEPTPEPAVAAPTVELMGVEIERGSDGRRVYVAAWATGGGSVELAWATNEQAYLFDCDHLPTDAPVSCEREGSVVIFTLLVGEGQRMFAVRATNSAGEAMTAPQRLSPRRRGPRR